MLVNRRAFAKDKLRIENSNTRVLKKNIMVIRRS